MSPLVALLRKEAYHIRRDRRTLVVVLALPVVQVLLFGSAIRTDVDRVRLAIVDPAPDEATLETGKPRLILVPGAPGVGKTALIDGLLNRVRAGKTLRR